MGITREQAARRRGAVRAVAAVLLAGWLGGCALPPALAVASYLGDGALELATGKDSTDMGLSFATGKDCATSRVFLGEDVCRDEVKARPEPLPPELAADEAAAETRVAALSDDEAKRLAATDRALAAAFQPLDASPAPLPQPALAVTTVVRLTPVAAPVRSAHPRRHRHSRAVHRHRRRIGPGKLAHRARPSAEMAATSGR